jgi:hypothetical protein
MRRSSAIATAGILTLGVGVYWSIIGANFTDRSLANGGLCCIFIGQLAFTAHYVVRGLERRIEELERRVNQNEQTGK